MDKGDIAAVRQVFALLQGITEGGGAGLQALAARCALSPRTAERVLQTMAGLGYVQQAGGHWVSTTRLFELGTRALRFPDLLDAARPAMRSIAEASGEAVQLGLQDDEDVVYLHRIESRHALGLSTPVGHREPLRESAVGLALLAWGGSEAAPDLASELRLVRRQGYSARRLPHLCSIAAPIFNHCSQVVAGLVVHVPAVRLTEGRLGDLTSGLQAATRDISAGLGCLSVPLAG